MDINNQLETLYEKHWDYFIKEGELLNLENSLNEKLQLVNPLLIKVDEEYVNADIKVMIYGQETWDWHKYNVPFCQDHLAKHSYFTKL